jgi:hypothetical protein
LALSYVWGVGSSLETTKANINMLQEEGVFKRPEVSEQIPRTIWHAIGLTAMLSLRFLWVDRLCICQDEEQIKISQISAMGGIYGNALVTILATAARNANDEIRGLQVTSEPRFTPGSEQNRSSPYFDTGWEVSTAFTQFTWVGEILDHPSLDSLCS